jgi:phosphotransferase system HPr (HPr) family protein
MNDLIMNDLQLEASESPRSLTRPATSAKQTVRVEGEQGLTMLSCSRFIEQLKQFPGRITISNGAISVDGRSILEMLQLAAVAGTVLTIEVVGPGAEQLLQRIAPLLASGV